MRLEFGHGLERLLGLRVLERGLEQVGVERRGPLSRPDIVSRERRERAWEGRTDEGERGVVEEVFERDPEAEVGAEAVPVLLDLESVRDKVLLRRIRWWCERGGRMSGGPTSLMQWQWTWLPSRQ